MIAVRGGAVILALDPRVSVALWRGSETPRAGWVSARYHELVPTTTIVASAQIAGSAEFTCSIVVADAA